MTRSTDHPKGKRPAMTDNYINRKLYDSIVNFDESEEAREHFYKTMDSETERNGGKETIREKILRVYAMLFCEYKDNSSGQPATADDVAETADRLYIGSMGYDPEHWYRMRHHFPVIDDDNYDRFAALVIADLSAGPLREAALNGDDMLLVGEPDPLHMTREERETQKVRTVSLDGFPPEVAP